MEMFLVKHSGLDLLVEDREAVALIEQHMPEILALKALAEVAMADMFNVNLSNELGQKAATLKAKFATKFVFGFPFDARSGELYALDKRISYTELNVE